MSKLLPSERLLQLKAEESEFFSKGRFLIDLNFDEALANFQQAYVINLKREGLPERPDILYFMSIALYRLGRYRESIEKSNEAIKLEPDDIAFHVSNSIACHKQAGANLDRTLAEVYNFKAQTYQKFVILEPMLLKVDKNQLSSLKSFIITLDNIYCVKENLKNITQSLFNYSAQVDALIQFHGIQDFDPLPSLTSQLQQLYSVICLEDKASKTAVNAGAGAIAASDPDYSEDVPSSICTATPTENEHPLKTLGSIETEK